jgi:HlyD family secretion protein
VEEGDSVEEGQVLVTLDKDEWDDELSKLEKALATAQRNLTTKQGALTKAERQVTSLERVVTTKENAVTEAERQIAAKEFAVRQAQLNVETAEYNLSQMDDVKKAQDDVDNAEFALKFANGMLTGGYAGGVELINYAYWAGLKDLAEHRLDEAEEELADILRGTSLSVDDDVVLEIAKKQLLVEQEQMDLENAKLDVIDAQKAVDDAKYALDEARLNVEDAKQAVDEAKLDVADAEQNMEEAQSDLDEAKSLSPEIKAPFAGFITKVNVEGGDEVLKGTVAVQLADPEKFEADILVSEMDISQVKLGGEAWVEVDAMSGMRLPATVTHIAPTATIQSGVVNYAVKVEIQSLEAVAQERQEARQQAMANIAAGELPAPLQQAIDEGRITREQVEEMIKQRQAAMASGAESGAPPSQVSTMTPENFQLREGLTVTVTIIVAEKTDVLLVPNAAITTEGRQSYVQVILPSGETEKRAVQTGLSNFQFTEVTEGLSEGEQILVPQGTTTTPTTTQQGPPRMGFFGPR